MSDTSDDDMDHCSVLETSTKTDASILRQFYERSGILHGPGSFAPLQPRSRSVYRRHVCIPDCLIFGMGNTNVTKGVDALYKSLAKTSERGLFRSPVDFKGVQTLISNYKPEEHYIFIQYKSSFFCSCTTQILNEAAYQNIMSNVIANQVEQNTRYQKGTKLQKYLTLMCENKAVTCLTDALALPSFSVLNLFWSVSLEWHIYHRYRLCYDHRYVIYCKTTDTLAEIRKQLLCFLGAVESNVIPAADSIWFTHKNKLVTDQLLKTFASVIDKSTDTGDLLVLSEHHSLLQLSEDRETGSVYIDVFVHFQPKDAIKLDIEFNSGFEEKTIKTIIMVSPQISAEELREEVSKVVRKPASALLILVGDVKIHSTTNLKPMLRESGCTIIVKPIKKAKVCVSVTTIPEPKSSETNINNVYTCFVYPYDTVRNILGLLTPVIGRIFREEQVEWKFHGRILDDRKSVCENRIEEGDKLEALVYLNRLLIRVRLPNRHWHVIVVDDSKSFTVGDLKAFARTVDGIEPFHNGELAAFVNDKFVPDTSILGMILDFANGLPRLLLIKIESFSFTTTTACERELAVFVQDSDGLRHVMAMFNGKKFLLDTPITSTNDKDFLDLLERRRHFCKNYQSRPGIRLHQNPEDFKEQRCTKNGFFSRHVIEAPSASTSSTVKPQDIKELKISTGSTKSMRFVGCKKKQQGIPKQVRFKTSNSTQKRNVGENSKSQSGETESSVCLAEENSSSDLAKDLVSDETEVKPDRNKSDSSRSLEATTSNQLTLPQRSVSCPPNPANVCRPSSLPMDNIHRSDSDTSVFRRNSMSREYRENLTQNPDGSLSVDQVLTTHARMTPELVKQIFNLCPISLPCLQQTPENGEIGCSKLHQNQQCPAVLLPDPAYKHVKEEIIRTVAQNMGSNNMFLRNLKITEPVIEKAMAAYPSDLVERNFYCLRNWCTGFGSDANVSVLKEALISSGRTDLAQTISEQDPAVPDEARSPTSPNNHPQSHITDPDIMH